MEMTTSYAAWGGYWEAEDGKEVWVCEDGKQVTPLPLRLDIDNKSPTGFAWGYAGSGPAQLAIAILAHATGDKVLAGNPRFFQRYTEEVVVRLPGKEGFVITKESVLEWVAARRVEEDAADEDVMLKWLDQEDYTQYGECHGRTLDRLIAKGLVQVHEDRETQDKAGFIARGSGAMYRAVSLTDAGREAILVPLDDDRARGNAY